MTGRKEKFLKSSIALGVCVCMISLCACTGSKISSEVEYTEVVTDMRSQIENSSGDTMQTTDDYTSASDDYTSAGDDYTSAGNVNSGTVPDQTIGNTDYTSNNSNASQQEQTEFIPISQKDAANNAEKFIESLATELKMPSNYKTTLNSSVSNYDNARLGNLINKALKGESLTIATIGGSITNGALASATAKNYPNRILAWFEKTFPNIKVKLVNAGIGATTSAMGAYRIKEDVLAYDPDLIVLEYAVNDNNNGEYLTACYEGLVRNALAYKDAAVICLYLAQQDKGTAQDGEQSVGNHYQLPQASMLNAFGNYNDWHDMFALNDNLHPNDLGHGRIGLLVDWLLTESLLKHSSSKTEYSIPSLLLAGASVYGKDDYLLKLNYSNSLSFVRNKSDVVNNKVSFLNKKYSLKTKEYKLSNHTFSVITVAKGKTLEMEINGVRGFCIIMNRDVDGGSANITVTEKDTGKANNVMVDSNFSFSHLWNTTPLYASSDGKQHNVKVKIESVDNAFSIAGFGIND